MDSIKNEGMKMSNFLYKLFILFFAVLMTLIMMPICLVIAAIDLIPFPDIFKSSEDDE